VSYVERFDVRIPDDDVAGRMERLEKPHHDEKVLKYLHFELGMSSGEIGRLFGVARQTIQKVVRGFDWEFHRRRGDSRVVGEEQRTLGEFERTTLEDLI